MAPVIQMSSVVLASGNRGKIAEFSDALAPLGWHIVPQGTLGITDVEETGLTFVENALLKARHAATCSGQPALADDSGLVVPALNGAPGIYSSRYSGQGDLSNNEKLLQDMADLSGAARRAFFIAVVVFLRHEQDPTPIIATGRWWGHIAHDLSGDGGFGYDPLFQPDDCEHRAAALSVAIKNQLSHRGQAIKALLAELSRD